MERVTMKMVLHSLEIRIMITIEMNSLGYMNKVYRMNIKDLNLMRVNKMMKKMDNKQKILLMKYQMRIDSYNMIYSVDLSIK